MISRYGVDYYSNIAKKRKTPYDPEEMARRGKIGMQSRWKNKQ